MPPIVGIVVVMLIGAASFFIGSMIIGAIAWLILKPISLFVKFVRRVVESASR